MWRSYHIPGNSPGLVNHKIDRVGHKVPDAEKKPKEARHKPHAERKMFKFHASKS